MREPFATAGFAVLLVCCWQAGGGVYAGKKPLVAYVRAIREGDSGQHLLEEQGAEGLGNKWVHRWFGLLPILHSFGHVFEPFHTPVFPLAACTRARKNNGSSIRGVRSSWGGGVSSSIDTALITT